MMDALIAEFPRQLEEALAIGQQIQLRSSAHDIRNIVVCGMGGSGIGANFAYEYIGDELKVPFMVVKGYDLPAFVDENTLVICSSYSGNTEETLAAFDQAVAKGARIICIASGGKLLEKATALGLDVVRLPAGKPSPRACLGYSFVQQLFILHQLGFTSDRAIQQVQQSVDFLEREQEDLKDKAEKVAGFLHEHYPILYISDRMEAVAVRLRQQLNENSKILCSHHVIPEMNHNELVGWREQEGNLAVIIFRNHDDHPRTAARMDINKELFRQYASTIELFSKGDNKVEQSLYFVHLGDWISWFMAELRGVDAVEVKVIDHLKAELGKV